MGIPRKDSRVWAALLLLVLLPGCSSGHKSNTQNNAKTAGGSKDEGKVYTPDSKSGGGSPSGGTSGNSGGQGGSSSTQLPSPADTSNGRASAASDAGTTEATKGQAVMTPGAPVEHQPKPQGSPKP